MQQILIFRYGQLGDTLVALPALWALRDHFADARFTLLSERPDHSHVTPEQVLPPDSLIDAYLTFPTARSGRGILEFIRLAADIRRRRFDAIIYLAPRLGVYPWRVRRDLWYFRVLCGVHRIVGQFGERPLPDPICTRPLTPIASEAESLLARLAVSGIPVPEGGGGRMDLALTAAEMRDAAAWWSSAGYSDGDRMRAVAIGAGSKVPSKVWPEDRFFALGRRLILEGGFLPVSFGGSEDRDVGERLVAGWGTGVVVAGRLTVRESAALMQGMCGYVGNDTGTMHLAAAAGLRCVGVFSAQDFPGRWDPYGSGHVVLRSCVPCEGCRLQMCDKGLKCLTSIDVDAVFNACDMTFRASG